MFPSAELQRILVVEVAVGGELHGAKFLPITDAQGSLPDNVVPADLHEPSFTGYTPGGVSVTWGVPYVAGSGLAETVGPNVPLLCTGDGAANVITGGALINTGGTVVLGIGFLDNPVTIQHNLEGVTLYPAVQLQSD